MRFIANLLSPILLEAGVVINYLVDASQVNEPIKIIGVGYVDERERIIRTGRAIGLEWGLPGPYRLANAFIPDRCADRFGRNALQV